MHGPHPPPATFQDGGRKIWGQPRHNPPRAPGRFAPALSAAVSWKQSVALPCLLQTNKAVRMESCPWSAPSTRNSTGPWRQALREGTKWGWKDPFTHLVRPGPDRRSNCRGWNPFVVAGGTIKIDHAMALGMRAHADPASSDLGSKVGLSLACAWMGDQCGRVREWPANSECLAS